MLGFDVAMLDAVMHAARLPPPASVAPVWTAEADFDGFRSAVFAALAAREREHKAWMREGKELRRSIRVSLAREANIELLAAAIDRIEANQRRTVRAARAVSRQLAEARRAAYARSAQDGALASQVKDRFDRIWGEATEELADLASFLRAMRSEHVDDGRPRGARIASRSEWARYAARLASD